MRNLELVITEGGHKAQFQAMACNCEVLMDVEDKSLAEQIAKTVAAEAWRIEDKFSRYRQENIVHRINTANGCTIAVDEETARLIDFAGELYDLSDGLFDITSGVLRRAWTFDGSDRLPEQSAIDALLQHIGWRKANWQAPELTLPAGMEIDLGGIGKEYAVDRCVQLVRECCSESVLVNFGGDLAVTGERKNHDYWAVGRLITGRDEVVALFKLYKGAIATSGDAHRFLLKDGVRYSHVLNPKTGWPVENPPHTVSVAAPTCVQAGMMSTLAMLQGADAEAFLTLQEVDYWLD